jgi:hypothetical protein
MNEPFDPEREDYPWQTVVVGPDETVYVKCIGKTDAEWLNTWENYFTYDIPQPAMVVHIPLSESWADDV